MCEQIPGTEALRLEVIAHIRTDFPEKFGVPRQSGLADTQAEIIFTPKYRNADALRGIEDYSHLWLIWGFSEIRDEKWRPMVRPPRLGGNCRKGVFATRSPYRPNPVGLSCVALEGLEKRTAEGTILHVRGADLTDGTPIYDIKPYLPYVDAVLDAAGGFSDEVKDYRLQVVIPDASLAVVPEKYRRSLIQILSQDPRPSYQDDAERVYGMTYADMEIKFQVKDEILTVCHVDKK